MTACAGTMASVPEYNGSKAEALLDAKALEARRPSKFSMSSGPDGCSVSTTFRPSATWMNKLVLFGRGILPVRQHALWNPTHVTLLARTAHPAPSWNPSRALVGKRFRTFSSFQVSKFSWRMPRKAFPSSKLPVPLHLSRRRLRNQLPLWNLTVTNLPSEIALR